MLKNRVNHRKWEIIYRDIKGEYHRATGTEIRDDMYVKFYRRGEDICCHKVLVHQLLNALNWDDTQKVEGGLSVKLIKQIFVASTYRN